jgi:hypothetical protein
MLSPEQARFHVSALWSVLPLVIGAIWNVVNGKGNFATLHDARHDDSFSISLGGAASLEEQRIQFDCANG